MNIVNIRRAVAPPISKLDEIALEYRAMRQVTQQVYQAVARMKELNRIGLIHDLDLQKRMERFAEELEDECQLLVKAHDAQLLREAAGIGETK